MRFVTGVANDPAGMVGGNHLRKRLRLGDVGFVTANTQHRNVDLRWLQRSWIVGVLGQRPVTGLARHMRMYALAFHVEHVGVTAFTCLVSGEYDRLGSDVGDGRGPVMTILSKGLGNKDRAQDQEQDDADGEDRRHAEKVPCILKICHKFDRECLVRLSIRLLDNDLPSESGESTSPSLIEENFPSGCAKRHNWL